MKAIGTNGFVAAPASQHETSSRLMAASRIWQALLSTGVQAVWVGQVRDACPGAKSLPETIGHLRFAAMTTFKA